MVRHLMKAVVVLTILGGAAGASAVERSETFGYPAEGIESVRFRDMTQSTVSYKGVSNATSFTVTFTRIVDEDDPNVIEEVMDELNLDQSGDGGVFTIRLQHPARENRGFLRRLWKRRDWKTKIEVTGPVDIDMDMNASFSTVRIDNTRGKQRSNTSFSEVSINGHAGSLSIENSFGGVTARDINGGVNVSTSFGDVDVQISRLSSDCRMSNSFGEIRLMVPRNSGATFRSDKSFGGIDFHLDGVSSISGSDNVRTINDGVYEIRLSTSFGGIDVRTGESASYEGNTGTAQYDADAVMPMTRGAWWRYSNGVETMTVRVIRTFRRGGHKYAVLTAKGDATVPFEKIDVCETDEGLAIGAVDGEFFGRDLDGMEFDEPRVWLPYEPQHGPGHELFGSARFKADLPPGAVEGADAAGVVYALDVPESLFGAIVFVPGVGITRFGDDLNMIDYDLGKIREMNRRESGSEPVVRVEKPAFERGKIESVNIRGTRLTTDDEIRGMLGIETGRVYSREEIEEAVNDIGSRHRLISSASYSVNDEGDLSVRVYEIDPYNWDVEPYVTFSRVAGLGTGLEATLKSDVGPLSEIGGGGQYHWHNEEWTFKAHANRRFFNRNTLEIGGTFRQAYESNMEWAIPRYDAYLNAFVLGLEPENYFYVEGGTGYVKQRIGSWLTASAAYFEDDYAPEKKHTNWSLFNYRHKKEDNPLLADEYAGRITGMRYNVGLKGSLPRMNAAMDVTVERTFDNRSDTLDPYTRVLAQGVYTSRFGYAHLMKLRVAGGYADDELPAQKAFKLGGLNTLRGFEFGTLPGLPPDTDGYDYLGGGNRMFLTNFDYYTGWDDDVRLVFFADVGGVWYDEEVVTASSLKRDVGIGIQLDGDIFDLEDLSDGEFRDGFRINWAVPVGPEPHVSNWTVNFVRAY